MAFVLLLVVSCIFSSTASVDGSRHDETLPVVNVKYDFPATDISSAGAQAKRHQQMSAFKKRAEQLTQRIDRDGEAMVEFVGLATESLDKLMSLFQRASSFLTAMHSHPKSVQLLEVSHKNEQSMMPLAPLALPQPVWQAGDPIKVNVDFDVPSHGVQEEVEQLRKTSAVERQVYERGSLLSSISPVQGLRLNQEKPRVTSFLSSQVLPVDAYKLRNSLFLTQPMRSPAAAAVNVVMREDVVKMKDQAKYQAMEDQTSRLQEEFEKSLAAMST